MSVIWTLASTENPLFTQASMSAAAAASSSRASLRKRGTSLTSRPSARKCLSTWLRKCHWPDYPSTPLDPDCQMHGK
jgi:hypothetical protein